MARTLKELRQAAGLTQHGLAVAVGALDSQVAGWEAGRARPSTKYIRPLAVALSVTTDEILDAIEHPARPS
jgi:transcriptional regulator with XRE-family HTH domain